ncbi:MAG: acyloxyacyl hydrolase [Elusimicrobia bacterium]|nr:acyloxyacyl hydrolase [Elusimicrobiota bacterium]
MSVWVLLAVMLLSCPASWSFPPPSKLSLLYGHALPAGSHPALKDGRYAMLAQRIRWQTSGPALGISLEPRAGYFYLPTGAGLAGLALVLDVAPGVSWIGLEAGAGTLWTDFPGLPSRLNFELFSGAAIRLPLPGSWSLHVGYRYHHISNAGLKRPNPGLDTHLPYISLGLPFSWNP